jgi:hypothetical protein
MANEADVTTRSASTNQICDRRQQRPVVQTHPEYRCRHDDYVRIDDCLEGERWIKEKGEQYLPKTSAQKDSDTNNNAYNAYKTRAIFYNYPKDTADAALGMMHREPASFELPTEMERLTKQSGPDGVPLEDALQDINEGQIKFGRYGLLVDVPDMEAPESVHIIKYLGPSIINWKTEVFRGLIRLRMVMLNESGYEIQQGGSHVWVDRYRMCALDSEGNYWTKVMESEEIQSVDTNTFDPPPDAVFPMYRGNTINFVPFTFINVSNLTPQPQVSPILDICDLSIAIYRKEADYGQAQFMQGQATPWSTGVSEDDRPSILGATTMMHSGNPEAQFGFMEVSGDGLNGMKEAIDEVKAQAIGKGVALVETGQRESGKALSIRTSSKTSILKTIAITGAQGLTQALEQGAVWMGVDWDDEANQIKPNMDFVDEDVTDIPGEFLKLIQAKNMGAPISTESVHQWAAKKELTSMTFDVEQEAIQGEEPVGMVAGVGIVNEDADPADA